MRSTDLDPEPWRPLGERITPSSSTPAAPKEREVAPGIIEGPDGRLHTNLPLPKDAPC